MPRLQEDHLTVNVRILLGHSPCQIPRQTCLEKPFCNETASVERPNFLALKVSLYIRNTVYRNHLVSPDCQLHFAMKSMFFVRDVKPDQVCQVAKDKIRNDGLRTCVICFMINVITGSLIHCMDADSRVTHKNKE